MSEVCHQLNRCWDLRQGPKIPAKASFAEEWTAIEEFLDCFPEALDFWPWEETPLAVTKQPEYQQFLQEWNDYVENQLRAPLETPTQLLFENLWDNPESFVFTTFGDLLDLIGDVAEQEDLDHQVSFQSEGDIILVIFRPETPQLCIGCGDV